MANTIEILVTAKNLTKPTFDTVGEQARTIGQKSGEEFSKGFEEKVKQDLPPAVDEPLNDLPPKGREKGKETGQQFGAGLSPLITAAFVGAATVGPAAILAGVSTAVVGAAALFAGSNKQVAQDASILGEQVKTSLTNAVAPIAGDIDAGITTLEQGVTRVTPELDQLFATAGPDATELASGLDQLAEGALPGIVSGVRAFAPEMHDVAADLGKIGQGVGGFVGGLSTGAAGSTTAFNALSKSLSEILPELGQVTGYLANGLGPAAADVLPVVNGLAKGVTLLTSALSPGEIQVGALAVTALFGAFKLAGAAGALQEGATFTSFLKGTSVAATDAEGKVKSFATKGIGGLSAALDVATGPLGLIIAGAGLLGNELGKISGVGDHTAANVDTLTSSLSDAANGSKSAQQGINDFANAMVFMNTGPLHATAGLKSLDDALTKLYQSNPQQAATEFAALSKNLEANGTSADQVAKDFPGYTKAVQDAALQSHLLGSQTDQLTASLIGAATAAQTSADQTAAQTLAALGATDGQNQLNIALDKSISDYEEASGKSSAYKTALDALYGKYQGYSAAQAAFTTDLANTATQLTKGKDAIDLTTKAGAANFTQLSNLSTANEQVAETLLKQSGSQDQANKALQAGAQKIDALAKSAGFTDTQIAQLNTDLYGTASIKDIAVHISANTADAYAAVGGLLSFVNSSGATIHVYETSDGVVHNTGMSASATATGGIIGGIGAAATGGVRGSWTWVGEHGPELLPLSPGTHVMSAPDSARIAAEAMRGGSGGAVGALELSVAEGSDSAVATLIMRLVRDGKLTIKQKAIVR